MVRLVPKTSVLSMLYNLRRREVILHRPILNAKFLPSASVGV